MKIINDFDDYKILSMTDCMKTEKWGDYVLKRPDPQIVWSNKTAKETLVDATYTRSKSGGGAWEKQNQSLPDSWQVKYKDLIFNLKLMGFKHTGLFPEQAFNWDLIREKIETANKDVKVLNLFGYTGAISVAALKGGASVVHVDASKGMVEWFKENVKANNLAEKNVRYIVDDCVKFVKRELRRENKYDIIIMDPPSFGRGASGEVWDIEKDLFLLIKDCLELLSENPILFIVNTYTTGLSPVVMENLLNITLKEKFGGEVSSDELCLQQESTDILLPCGITSRWENKNSN